MKKTLQFLLMQFSLITKRIQIKSNQKGITFLVALLSISGSLFAQICNTDVTNGIATTSITASAQSVGFESYKAFDNNISTYWLTPSPIGYLQVDLGTAQMITNYSIMSATLAQVGDPKDFNLSGSNDGTNFTVLHTMTGETFATRSLIKYYSFANSTAYRFYRLTITLNNGHTQTLIGEIQLLPTDNCIVGNVYMNTTGVGYPNIPIFARAGGVTVASTTTDASGAFAFTTTTAPVANNAILVQPPVSSYFLSGPIMNLNASVMPAQVLTYMQAELWPTGSFLNVYTGSYLIDNNQGAKTPTSLDWVLKQVPVNASGCTTYTTTLDGNGTFGNMSTTDYVTEHAWQPGFGYVAHPNLFKPFATATTGYTYSNTYSANSGVLYTEGRYNITSFIGTIQNGGFNGQSATAPLWLANYNLENGAYGGWRKTYGCTTGDPYDQFLVVNGQTTAAGSIVEFTTNITTTGTKYLNFYGKNANASIQGINTPVNVLFTVTNPASVVVANPTLSLSPVTSAAQDQPTSPWDGRTVSFPAATTGTYTIKLTIPSGSTMGNDFYLDNIEVSDCEMQFAITGNVFNDVNGLKDNTVNGTGTNAGGLNAVLINVGTGLVVATAPVNADGTYSFPLVNTGDYNIEITTNTATVGLTPPVVALPSGWVITGENLGTGIGSDGLVNGILSLGTVTSNVTDANFGIEVIPTAGSGSNSAGNPGGTTQVLMPANTFTNSSLSTDATLVTGIVITAFPTGATSIVIGGVTYTTLAEIQVAYPNGIPTDANGNPIPTITVDPTNTGATTVTISFKAIDAAGKLSSNTGTAVLNLTAPVTVSGNVWDDLNKDAVNSSENPITSGVWVNLVDPVSHNVISSVQVDASGNYSIPNLAQNTSYQIILSNASQTGNLNLTVSSLPTGYASTGTNLDGVANTGNRTGIITINSGTGGLTNQNFGITFDWCNPLTSGNVDSDNDGVTDVCDLDDDNDGILDTDEKCNPPAFIGWTEAGLDTSAGNVTTTLGGETITVTSVVTSLPSGSTSFIGNNYNYSGVITADAGTAIGGNVQLQLLQNNNLNGTTKITFAIAPGKFGDLNVFLSDFERTSIKIYALDASNNLLPVTNWDVKSYETSGTTPASDPNPFVKNATDITFSAITNTLTDGQNDDTERIRIDLETLKTATKKLY